MNIQLMKNFSIYQWVKFVAAAQAVLLALILVSGAFWAAALPLAPSLAPSSEALQAVAVVLPANATEVDYLKGFSPARSTENGAFPANGSELSIMASRPLFWMGRRPVIIDETKIEDVEEDVSLVNSRELDKVKLVGIYYAGDISGAIVWVDGKRRRIALGESLMGWRLESVDPSEVNFSNGVQGKMIRLEHVGVSD